MAKDIGMTIRKGIVVSFLPCLVTIQRYGQSANGGGERKRTACSGKYLPRALENRC